MLRRPQAQTSGLIFSPAFSRYASTLKSAGPEWWWWWWGTPLCDDALVPPAAASLTLPLSLPLLTDGCLSLFRLDDSENSLFAGVRPGHDRAGGWAGSADRFRGPRNPRGAASCFALAAKLSDRASERRRWLRINCRNMDIAQESVNGLMCRVQELDKVRRSKKEKKKN